MKHFWFVFYNIFFLPLFWILIHLSSVFNSKIRIALRKRKFLFNNLQSELRKLNPNKKNILLQCSSLGEFHQAKPVIAELDKADSYNFIISFFSPSGYDNFDADKDLKISGAIIKTFLPFDWYLNVKRFIHLINPSAVLFIKYDLWYNFLYYLNRQKIYSTLINAKFRKSNIKWKFIIRSFYKAMLNFFNAVITADIKSEEEYRKILSRDTIVINYGDTKIEYISRTAGNQNRKAVIDEAILKNKTIFIAGSTWEEDDDLILPVIDKIYSKYAENGLSLLTIIAPHEPDKNNLDRFERRINEYKNIRAIRFSELNNYNNQNLILVDSIGLLFSLYKYSALAYVGGGLRTGLHNVLEPASYGIPVLFGNIKISADAEQLLNKGSGIAVGNAEELHKWLIELLKEKDKRKELGLRSISVFEKMPEASKKIAELVNSPFEES